MVVFSNLSRPDAPDYTKVSSDIAASGRQVNALRLFLNAKLERSKTGRGASPILQPQRATERDRKRSNDFVNTIDMNNQNLNGIYLVVDPSMDHKALFDKIEEALVGGVDILQIWNRWPDGMSQYDKEQMVTYLTEMAGRYDVPVLMNEAWEILKSTPLDGVHFDEVPENINQIREEIGRDFISGITCSNDLEIIEWAEEYDFDYVSFCAMFPSPSVGSCEIVEPETVKKAREITSMPLFLSGGITPDKIDDFADLDFDGVAVISGILKDENPREKTSRYKQALEEWHKK